MVLLVGAEQTSMHEKQRCQGGPVSHVSNMLGRHVGDHCHGHTRALGSKACPMGLPIMSGVCADRVGTPGSTFLFLEHDEIELSARPQIPLGFERRHWRGALGIWRPCARLE